MKSIFKYFFVLLASLNILFSLVFYDQSYFISPKQNSVFKNAFIITLNEELVPIPTQTYVRCVNASWLAPIPLFQVPFGSVVFVDKQKINYAIGTALFPAETNVMPEYKLCNGYEFLFKLEDGNYSALVVYEEEPKTENTYLIALYYVGLFALCLVSAILLRPVEFLNKIASMFYFFLFIVVLLFALFLFDVNNYLNSNISIKTLFDNFFNSQFWVFLVLLLVMFWIFVVWHFRDIVLWFKNVMNKF